jgi:hypothetical protein
MNNIDTETFTKRLYKQTKDSHTQVDRHPFVQLIRESKNAADLYITFNKICIYAIENVFLNLDLFKKTEYNNFLPLFYKLKRNIDINDIDIYISPNLQTLLNKCRMYPLEHAYMFYLGLMMGYKLLKKYVSDDILEYNDSDTRLLVKDFKDYLDNNVDISNQQEFINIVSQSYILIKNIFDEYEKLDTFLII